MSKNKRNRWARKAQVAPSNGSQPAPLATGAPAEVLADAGPSNAPRFEISDEQLSTYAATVDDSSEKRTAANRANAQLSSGPRTSAGKAASSLNAVKTGLTGRTVLLPTDDVADYERHMQAYESQWAPVGQVETDLVRSIAETAWRLMRIPGLECSVYAAGAIELAEEFEEHDPELRPGLIQLAVHFKYERQLRNLQLQESRLVRRREKEVTELRELQKERKANQAQQQTQVQQRRAVVAAQSGNMSRLLENGFEFTTAANVTYSDALAQLSTAGMPSR